MEGVLYVPPGSSARRFAEAVAWLWRLGPVLDAPRPGAVGMGWVEETGELDGLLQAGELAATVVFCPRPGPDVGWVPPRERVRGVAAFGPGVAVRGQFSIIHGGEEWARSSLGVHAVASERRLAVAADPVDAWGGLDSFWVFEALGRFLVEVLDRPLVLLPPVGWARYDDVPGNGHQQRDGRTKPDAVFEKRIRRLTDHYGGAGARLNLAVSSAAYDGDEVVEIDRVWPRAIGAIADGIEAGVLEVVHHGYLHLDTELWSQGRMEPREFRTTSAQEAGRRLDFALDWAPRALRTQPGTFVAPTWSYGDGLLAALAERNLPAWLPPLPGPLVSGHNAFETLLSTLEGLHRLDYGAFATLAAAGMPATVVIHGGLFDNRLAYVSPRKDPLTFARLVARRDLFRAPWTEGVEWLGAADLMALLKAHGQIEVGDTVEAPAGARAILWDRDGRRPLRLEADR